MLRRVEEIVGSQEKAKGNDEARRVLDPVVAKPESKAQSTERYNRTGKESVDSARVHGGREHLPSMHGSIGATCFVGNTGEACQRDCWLADKSALPRLAGGVPRH